MFKNYKKYEYKVKFNTDNIMYLSSNQRAKLQYHILARWIQSKKINLVIVDNQDKEDLICLSLSGKHRTSKIWANRMLYWEDGIEKMISFGVALDVRSVKNKDGNDIYNVKDIYCYRMKIDDNKAIYTGISMTWERWKQGIIDKVNSIDTLKKIRYNNDNEKEYYNRLFDECKSSIYYQNDYYMTFPLNEKTAIEKWFADYYWKRNIELEFPFSGIIQNAELSFAIDFYKDIDIVDAHYIGTSEKMAEHNRQNNDRHNKKMGEKQSRETFNKLKGDTWTTGEIKAQGFNDLQIRTWRNTYKWIKKIGKIGNMFIYARNIVATKTAEHSPCV
jgi:hypothetical protein